MQVAEHLVLKLAGFMGKKYTTKYHDDLGDDLQTALETLEQEGWEVVTCYLISMGTPEIILKRIPR